MVDLLEQKRRLIGFKNMNFIILCSMVRKHSDFLIKFCPVSTRMTAVLDWKNMHKDIDNLSNIYGKKIVDISMSVPGVLSYRECRKIYN